MPNCSIMLEEHKKTRFRRTGGPKSPKFTQKRDFWTIKLLFEPPQFDKKVLHHIYNSNNTLLEKLKKGLELNKNEEADLINLPETYLICYLNLFHEAIDKLNEARPFIKKHSNDAYMLYKESIRILRKVKYS